MGALKVRAAGIWQVIVGPQGAQGPTGPQGPQGPSGFEIGMPAPWLLDTNPASGNWLLANGGTFDGTVYPALAALYGSTFGAVSGNLYRLPNLTGKFLVGQDTADTGTVGVDRISAVRDTGGAKRVTLSASESGTTAHGHDLSISVNTQAETAEHTHGWSTVGTGGHEHVYGGRRSNRVVTGGGAATVTDSAEGTWWTTGGGGHDHSGTTGGRSASHTHGTTVGYNLANAVAAAAAASHQNMPPFYVCRWVIRALP